MSKLKEINWKSVINFIITFLTALGGAIAVQSCK